MDKQLIISIGREYGSGGRAIADILSEHYNIPIFDREFFKNYFELNKEDGEKFENIDEKPRGIFFGRTVGKFNNSKEDFYINQQFNVLREHADKGDSFIVVGRCANEILEYNPNMVSFFIWADMDYRLKNIMERDNCDIIKAMARAKEKDRVRNKYYSEYCKTKWGAGHSYDMMIRATNLSKNDIAEIIINYIEKNMDKLRNKKGNH